jgi:hypothetical protein
MMEQYNGYWISGSAVPGPPYTTYWNPSGDVLFQRANGSVVELVRFTLHTFKLDDDGVATLFGLELARLVVDTCSPELMCKQQDVEQRTKKPLRGR